MKQATVDFRIKPGGKLQGTIRVPGDKSISHRAIMLGAIAEGITQISGFLEGADCLATLQAFRDLGVKIEGPQAGNVTIHGVGLHGLKPPHHFLDLGNSGTSIRLLSGIMAAQTFDSVLTGDQYLCKRPMARIAKPLNQMGAQLKLQENSLPPIEIKGGQTLHGIAYEMPIASAQVKSCLLLAGLYAKGETTVTEPAPTRDHTERMLEAFGVTVTSHNSMISIQGGQTLQATTIAVPADISSAAFFMVGASIAPGSDILLKDVGINPCRAGVLNILSLMGADFVILNERRLGQELVADIHFKSSQLMGIDIPVDQVPLAIDEFPVLFIAAACAKGVTTLHGAEELRVKESDRIQVMADGLHNLGIAAEVLPDGIRITGGEIRGGQVNSHGDHRIAMAFAMAGLAAKGEIMIEDCANVTTSFPEFVQLAGQTGLKINPIIRNVQAIIPVIAVDGPGGTGKGTLSRLLAKHLGWHFLDSGALYRILAFVALKANTSLQDEDALTKLIMPLQIQFLEHPGGDPQVFLDGQEITQSIRSEQCGQVASQISTFAKVRRALVKRQQEFRQLPGLVADGRDMGTIIFPDAQLKIYLIASQEERARRRYEQLKKNGINASLQHILAELCVRDLRDQNRIVAPLKPAADAVVIDTSALDIEQVFERVLLEVEKIWPSVSET